MLRIGNQKPKVPMITKTDPKLIKISFFTMVLFRVSSNRHISFYRFFQKVIFADYPIVLVIVQLHLHSFYLP